MGEGDVVGVGGGDRVGEVRVMVMVRDGCEGQGGGGVRARWW
jgi:hypothetical protein